MQELNGTYIWHYVDNENKIKGVCGGAQYLVCAENSTEKGSIWNMQLAFWFCKGDELLIRESNGTPHRFNIDNDGFYVVDDIKGKVFYRVLGVRFWTELMKPEVDPEDILTILE